MPIPTVPISVSLFEIVGTGLLNATVALTLTASDIYTASGGGLVPVSRTTAKTDTAGNCSLTVFPNALGTLGTGYRVEVFDSTGARVFDGRAIVPNVACKLHEVLHTIPPMLQTDADRAVVAAQAATARATSIPAAIVYTFDDPTAAADPGAGRMRLNALNMETATAAYLSNTDRAANAVAGVLDFLGSGPLSTKAVLAVKDGTTERTAFYRVTAVVALVTYRRLDLVYLSGATGALTDESPVGLGFTMVGNLSAAGADKQVTFNDAGFSAGNANFTYDKATNKLTLVGTLDLNGAAALTSAGLQAGSGHKIGFTDIANATGTLDTWLKRDSAGAMSVRKTGDVLADLNLGALTAGSISSPSGTLTTNSVFKFGSYVVGNATYGVLINNATDTLNIARFNNNGTTEFWGHALPSTFSENAADLGSLTQRWRTGYFGTSVQTTLVTTGAPGAVNLLLNAGSSVHLQSAGVSKWALDAANDSFRPLNANAFDLGTSTVPVRTGYFGTRVVFGTGFGAPTVGSTSAGLKLLLYPGLDVDSVDYGVGVEDSHVWHSVPDLAPSTGFRWYGAATMFAELKGDRRFNLYNTYTDAINYERGFIRWNANFLEFGAEAAGTGSPRNVTIRTGAAEIDFVTSGSSRWKYTSAGHLLAVLDNNYDIGAAGATRPRNVYIAGLIGAEGGQIKFPATQNASADANTLDDYEEGTFTPTITFGGAAVGVTYANQEGKYTKVGRVVHFRIYLVLASKGSSTGALSLAGLPFTNANEFTGAGSVWVNSMSGLSGSLAAYINPLATTISLRQLGTGTAATITDTNVADNSAVMVSGTYFV